MCEGKELFDLVVIGGGPGGYVSAIWATRMGLGRVALIEKGDLGGTCLNVGCIPTKTLIANAQALRLVKEANRYGIEVGEVRFDYGKMKERKGETVRQIRGSLERLLKSHGVQIIRGKASFLSSHRLTVEGQDALTLETKHVIIATGSEPIHLPCCPCDHRRIYDSTSVLDMDPLPKSMTIVGGGYIGCEFASLFAEMKVKVSIIEASPAIMREAGETISSSLTSAFAKKRIDIFTHSPVEKVSQEGDELLLSLGGGRHVRSETILVAIGRRPYTHGLDLDRAGLSLGEGGSVVVNSHMESPVAGVYAIGDVIGRVMLAHAASHQGIIAVSNICGKPCTFHDQTIPGVIFTHPEVAYVGLSAERARAQGLSISVGKFPFRALGKSVAALHTEGFVEIVSDRDTQAILGAQAVGSEASTMISEMALAINNELTLDCVTDTIHPHPTLSEAWLEAAFIASGTPIHLPPRGREGV